MMIKESILLAVAPESLPFLESVFSNGDKFNLAMTHSGLEACRLIKERQPHLVFMDLYAGCKWGRAAFPSRGEKRAAVRT